MKKLLLIFISITSQIIAQNRLPQLHYLGQHIIKNNYEYKGTRVGGLSGIEYISDSTFYFISDDYGSYGYPRFYETAINYSDTGIAHINFKNVYSMKAPSGKQFIAKPVDDTAAKFLISDAEAVRYDVESKQFFWSSEGYKDKDIIFQPFIYKMDSTGTFLNSLPLHYLFNYTKYDKVGLKPNNCIESMTFVPHSNLLVYCSEQNLLQDKSLWNDSVISVRMTFADKQTGKVVSQYLYVPDNTFQNGSNGVSEILSISKDTLLVLERAYKQGVGNCVKLYMATVGKAFDVKYLPAVSFVCYHTMEKKLIADLSNFGIPKIDNIECMTWGYPVRDYSKTLLFASDNNFSNSQITQVLLFGVK